MGEIHQLNKFISIINRQANRFYNRKLNEAKIGCGQYFFLLRIHEHEGISVLDLARTGYYDKGTTAKAIQKLGECGYIKVTADENDRRIHRLYTTARAAPVIDSISEAKKEWDEALMHGLSPQEIENAAALLEKMAERSYAYVNQMEMEEIESSTSNTNT